MRDPRTKQTKAPEKAILRIADAIEDAPYEVQTAKALDVTLAASCNPDNQISQISKMRRTGPGPTYG